MISSPATVIHQLLLDLGLAVQVGDSPEEWTAYIAFLPDAPDQAIVVHDTAGTLDGRIMRTGEQIEHHGIQIRVRGRDYASTWEKARSIASTLDAQNNVAVDTESGASYNVQNISRTGAMIPLGVDAEDARRRCHITINAVITMTEDE